MAVITSHKQAMAILDKHKVVMPFSKEGIAAMREAVAENEAKAKAPAIELGEKSESTKKEGK